MILNRAVFTLLVCMVVPMSMAADLQIQVVDSQQVALADAVVELIPDVMPDKTTITDHYEMSQKKPYLYPLCAGSS